MSSLFNSKEESSPKINYTKEAFLSQYNLIPLIGLGVFTLIGGGLPALFVGVGAELLHLVFTPEIKRFRRAVEANKAKERRLAKKALTKDLIKSLKLRDLKKYNEVKQLASIIRNNYNNLGSISQSMLDSSLQRLNNLLDSYIRLLILKDQQANYLKNTDEKDIKKDLEKLSIEIKDASPRVKEIQQRRIGILKKRLEKLKMAKEHGRITQAQLLTIEDVLKLTRDQSYAMKDPSQISDQLDSLMLDVETTEETVKEMESFFEVTDRLDPFEHVSQKRRIRE